MVNWIENIKFNLENLRNLWYGSDTPTNLQKKKTRLKPHFSTPILLPISSPYKMTTINYIVMHCLYHKQRIYPLENRMGMSLYSRDQSSQNEVDWPLSILSSGKFLGKKGPVKTGYFVSPFGPKDGYLRVCMMTAWIKSEASEKIKIVIVISAKLACSQGTYWAEIKDTYGESQTMMP